MSKETFAVELRDFRQGSGLTRKDMADLLGVSDFTVRSWENGQSNPQSSTLWSVLERLARANHSQPFRRVDVAPLRSLIEAYARSVDLSPVESVHTKLLRIERTLSRTVLKAAQTDFEFDANSGVLRAVPFFNDLELFQAANGLHVRQMLENAADAAQEISTHLNGANLEQRYLKEALVKYAVQCEQALPNPRTMERKGSYIRFIFSSEDIGQSLNAYIVKEISQFLDIHDELMRGLFGQALASIREVRSDRVSESRVLETPREFQDAAKDISALSSAMRSDGTMSPGVDPEVAAIVADIGAEAEELARGVQSANDPSVRKLRLARLQSTVFHGALLLGRLLLRVSGVALTSAASAASILSVLEIAKPGSVVAAYNMLRSLIPDLPLIPSL